MPRAKKPTVTTVEALLDIPANWTEMVFCVGAPTVYFGLTLGWARQLMREKYPDAVMLFEQVAKNVAKAQLMVDSKILATSVQDCREDYVLHREAVQVAGEQMGGMTAFRQACNWAERQCLVQLGFDLPPLFRRRLLNPAFREEVIKRLDDLKYGVKAEEHTQRAVAEGVSVRGPQAAVVTTPASALDKPAAPLASRPAVGAPFSAVPETPVAAVGQHSTAALTPRQLAARLGLQANGFNEERLNAMDGPTLERHWEQVRNMPPMATSQAMLSSIPVQLPGLTQAEEQVKVVSFMAQVREAAVNGVQAAKDLLTHLALLHSGDPGDDFIASHHSLDSLQKRFKTA